MKAVALVSGGKDSCYNMVMCEHYGHKVVALGNLLPQAADTDDLDSYMYQTVGHQVIEAYAQCMGLPLFRRRIQGASKQQHLVYEDTEGDEVEDLYSLLAYVKQQLPEVQAVASGAIASDYQRTRVERVCGRLGLVSLAYLWQQPQAPLLQRMIEAHIDAILVKVAAAGLTSARHLGAPLAALPRQLAQLRRLYGCNVCGEGGEYESLTLDCPLFTRARIVLDSWQEVMVSADSLAPVALLHPTAFHIEVKQGQQLEAGEVLEVPHDFLPSPPSQPAASTSIKDVPGPGVHVHTSTGAEYVTITAEVSWAGFAIAASAPSSDPASSGTGNSSSSSRSLSSSPQPCSPLGAAQLSPAATGAAVTEALAQLAAAMSAAGLSWQSTLFVHLYVPSMAHFGAANEAYSRFFPPVNPPARATVEIGPNSRLAVVVEVLFARRPQGRRVLHVQSISQWAPSCIGPYSQALSHGGLVLMAGQIPLDPPTMAMVGGGLDAQCVRALHSCQAVGVAKRTDLPNSMLWCTTYCSGAAGAQRAAHHLSAFLAGRLEPLPFGDRSTEGGAAETVGAKQGGVGSDDEGESGAEDAGDAGGDLEPDEYLVPPPMTRHWQPLQTYLVMPELPRGALVEVQPVACLVDGSIDAPSSSDSSDDEAASGSRAGREGGRAPGAAAAQLGSMPGWIGRLEERQQLQSLEACPTTAAGEAALGAATTEPLLLHCRELSCKGRLCRAQVSLSPTGPLPTPAGSAPTAAPQQHGGLPDSSGSSSHQVLASQWHQAVTNALLGALGHAELEPADVAAVKVYCPGEAAVEAGQQVRGLLAGALGQEVQAIVVPVLAVGSSADLSSRLLIELLAVRLPHNL